MLPGGVCQAACSLSGLAAAGTGAIGGASECQQIPDAGPPGLAPWRSFRRARQVPPALYGRGYPTAGPWPMRRPLRGHTSHVPSEPDLGPHVYGRRKPDETGEEIRFIHLKPLLPQEASSPKDAHVSSRRISCLPWGAARC